MARKKYLTTAAKSIAIILVLYNEFLTYTMLPFSWPTPLECISPNCVSILLVADPQILGQQDSSRIAKWDCDRYLSKTFGYAIHHTTPDIIIFLGDQMDEGHIASDNQFHSDLERFRSIFLVPDHFHATAIYLPGDNDIGGEGDPILPHNVHRFDAYFDQSIEPTFYQDKLEFYKINKMTSLFQEPESLDGNFIRIGLSHMPILRRIHTISKSVATSMRPHLILSGHDHDGMHVAAPTDNVWQKQMERIIPAERNWLHYKLSNDTIHEIIVPTCSYRMGMLEMGYGFAQIDTKASTVAYTVLWLPGRLTQLYVYLGFLILVGLIVCCFALVHLHHRLRRLMQKLFSKSFANQPLLIP